MLNKKSMLTLAAEKFNKTHLRLILYLNFL